MALKSRYAIIPLKLDNKGFAEIGEPSFDWENAEYELKMPDGSYINPFEKLRDWVYTVLENIDVTSSTGPYTFEESGIYYDSANSSQMEYILGGSMTSPTGNDYISTDSYIVFATPRYETQGRLGEQYVVNIEGTTVNYQIQLTGESYAGVMYDWVFVYLTELTTYSADTFPIIVGASSFKSIDSSTDVAYQTIEIPEQSDTDYYVIISPAQYATGDVGEIIVEKSTTSIKVINTGGTESINKEFNFMIVGSNINDLYDSYSMPIMAGHSTFDKDEGLRQIAIESSDTNYYILLQPTGDAEGNIGQIALGDKTTTYFEVTNTGETDVAFDWVMFKRPSSSISSVSMYSVNEPVITRLFNVVSNEPSILSSSEESVDEEETIEETLDE